jgi:hypothetical protein
MKTTTFSFPTLTRTLSLSLGLVAAQGLWAQQDAAPGTMGGKTKPVADVAAVMGASATLDAGATVMKARTADFAARDEIVTQMSARLDASVKSLHLLQDRSTQFKGQVSEEFKAALNNARTREQQTRKSIDFARSATAETWREARSNVAADYEAYAAALTRIEAVASVGTTKADAKVGAAGTVETKSLEPKEQK